MGSFGTDITRSRRRFLRRTGGCAAAAAAVSATGWPLSTALAQPTRPWPERALKIVVGFAPGGGNDVTARLIATAMGNVLGQSVVVENKSGAGGVIGAQSVAQAPADGYTLMLGTSSQLVMNLALYNKLSFDTQKDLASVALISRTPLSLLCRRDLPVKTLADFIAHAKSKPGVLNYGTVGPGSITHVAAEVFVRAANIQMQAVHYRGQSNAYQAIMGGEIDMVMDGTPNTAGELVAADKVRALAISLQRSASLPGVPTFREAGLPEADSYTWNSVMVPTGTPPALVDKLNQAVNQAIRSAPVQEFFAKGGIESLGGSTPASTNEFWRAEVARWVPIVKGMNISLD